MSKPVNVGAAQTRAETQTRARLEAKLAAGVTAYQQQLAFAKPLMRAYSTAELNTGWSADKTQLKTAEQALDQAMGPLKATELNLGELLHRLAPVGTKRDRFIDAYNNLNPGIASRLVDPGDRAAYLKSLK